MDASFMTHLLMQIQVRDVAVTDLDPQHLATNLQTVRGRCKKLFTLAIALSPLHDGDALYDSEHGSFNRKFVSKDVLQLWEPFWTPLEHLKSSFVRVWEGRGSKRPKFENTAV